MQNRKPVILARSADPEAQPQMRRAYTRRQEKPQCALVILVGFAAAFALFVWAGLKIADWEIEQEAIGERAGAARARASRWCRSVVLMRSPTASARAAKRAGPKKRIFKPPGMEDYDNY